MNNFTKSIVYSGVVLAAGLVAIFAIYNNMGTDASNMSYIEPASGEETFTENAEEAFDATVDAVEETAEDAQAAIEETVEGVETAIEEADAAETPEGTETPDAAETESASETAPEGKPAPEGIQKTEPASGDAVIENAKELLEESKAEESAE